MCRRQLARQVEEIDMTARMTGSVLRDLGITPRQMQHLLIMRPELEPGRIGALRMWTAADVDRVRVALAERAGKKKQRAAS